MAPTVYSPPVNTYTPLAEITLAATNSLVTLTGFSQDYRDLVLVMNVKKTSTGDANVYARLNGDLGSNYSWVGMLGSGSTESSTSATTDSFWAGEIDSSNFYVNTVELLDFSATDKHKPILTRGARGSRIDAFASRWASASAITSISIFPTTNSFEIGSSFKLFGIKA